MAWGKKGLRDIRKQERGKRGSAYAGVQGKDSTVHFSAPLPHARLVEVAKLFEYSLTKFAKNLLVKDAKGKLVATLTPYPNPRIIVVPHAYSDRKQALHFVASLLE